MNLYFYYSFYLAMVNFSYVYNFIECYLLAMATCLNWLKYRLNEDLILIKAQA